MKLSVSLPVADPLHGGCGKGRKESSQREKKGEKEKSKGNLCGHGLAGYSLTGSTPPSHALRPSYERLQPFVSKQPWQREKHAENVFGL